MIFHQLKKCIYMLYICHFTNARGSVVFKALVELRTVSANAAMKYGGHLLKTALFQGISNSAFLMHIKAPSQA